MHELYIFDVGITHFIRSSATMRRLRSLLASVYARMKTAPEKLHSKNST